ncbi:unnamed protein product, partial [Phaeothamnion confervicola]
MNLASFHSARVLTPSCRLRRGLDRRTRSEPPPSRHRKPPSRVRIEWLGLPPPRPNLFGGEGTILNLSRR